MLLARDHTFLSTNQGHTPAPPKLHKTALVERECVLGSHRPEMLKSEGDLVLVLNYQGQTAQSAAVYFEVCQVYRDTLRLSYSDTIKSLRNMAVLFHFQLDLGSTRSLVSLRVRYERLDRRSLRVSHG